MTLSAGGYPVGTTFETMAPQTAWLQNCFCWEQSTVPSWWDRILVAC